MIALGETFRSPVPDGPTSLSVGNSFALSGEAQELVLAIAQLDEEFAQGAVSKESYQKRRSAWKKQLTELLS